MSLEYTNLTQKANGMICFNSTHLFSSSAVWCKSKWSQLVLLPANLVTLNQGQDYWRWYKMVEVDKAWHIHTHMPTQELQGFENKVARTRGKFENNPTPRNNIAHKVCTAKYQKAYIQYARKIQKSWTWTEKATNFGNWPINDEETRASPFMIQRNQETVTGMRAENCLIESYEQVSNIMIPNNRKQQVHDEIKSHQGDQDPPEYTNCMCNT